MSRACPLAAHWHPLALRLRLPPVALAVPLPVAVPVPHWQYVCEIANAFYVLPGLAYSGYYHYIYVQVKLSIVDSVLIYSGYQHGTGLSRHSRNNFLFNTLTTLLH